MAVLATRGLITTSPAAMICNVAGRHVPPHCIAIARREVLPGYAFSGSFSLKNQLSTGRVYIRPAGL
jgi:hypothetical protein